MSRFGGVRRNGWTAEDRLDALAAVPWIVDREVTPDGDRLLRIREIPSASGAGSDPAEREADLWASLRASLRAYIHIGDPVPLPCGGHRTVAGPGHLALPADARARGRWQCDGIECEGRSRDDREGCVGQPIAIERAEVGAHFGREGHLPIRLSPLSGRRRTVAARRIPLLHARVTAGAEGNATGSGATPERAPCFVSRTERLRSRPPCAHAVGPHGGGPLESPTAVLAPSTAG